MNDMTEVPVVPATNKIAEALAKAAGGITNPVKNREVTVKSDKGNYKFKYATFDAILDSIRKPLSENGLWFVQTLEDNRMVTTLYHSSGQCIISRIPFVAGGNGPQAMGSALTYAKRYGLCALLGIAADEDDDANAAEGNSIEKSEPKKAQPRTVPEKSAQQSAPESTDKGAEGPSPGAVKFADSVIAKMAEPETLGGVFSYLSNDHGVLDIDDAGEWHLEASSKLVKLRNTAPTEFKRVQNAYEARKTL